MMEDSMDVDCCPGARPDTNLTREQNRNQTRQGNNGSESEWWKLFFHDETNEETKFSLVDFEYSKPAFAEKIANLIPSCAKTLGAPTAEAIRRVYMFWEHQAFSSRESYSLGAPLSWGAGQDTGSLDEAAESLRRECLSVGCATRAEQVFTASHLQLEGVIEAAELWDWVRDNVREKKNHPQSEFLAGVVGLASVIRSRLAEKTREYEEYYRIRNEEMTEMVNANPYRPKRPPPDSMDTDDSLPHNSPCMESQQAVEDCDDLIPHPKGRSEFEDGEIEHASKRRKTEFSGPSHHLDGSQGP